MLLNVTYYEEKWDNWDSEELTVQEMLLLEEETGFSRVQGPNSMLMSAYACEARGAQALIWWLRGHNGHARGLADLKPGKLRIEIVPEPDPLDEPDSEPTEASSSESARSASAGPRRKSTS
jgi:hypothetical protein